MPLLFVKKEITKIRADIVMEPGNDPALFCEPALLRDYYLRALSHAGEAKVESIAFPLIAEGKSGCPEKEAVKIAEEVILGFLETHDLTVYLVFGSGKDFRFGVLDVPAPTKAKRPRSKRKVLPFAEYCCVERPAAIGHPALEELSAFDALPELDESFSEALLRMIDERGMKDSDCYKKANIDRKLFSKIRSNRFYKPKKATVIAFSFALELSLEETELFLKKAGFALSASNYFDVIIRTCLERKIYDIIEVNEILFDYDQPLLGAAAD